MGIGNVISKESYQELFRPQLESENHNEGILSAYHQLG
jgi:hypothetical protein